MNDTNQDIKIVVASDVSNRDGIGVEIYKNDEMVLEIFRDDSKKERKVFLDKSGPAGRGGDHKSDVAGGT